MKSNYLEKSPSELSLREISELVEKGRKLHDEAVFDMFASFFKMIIAPFKHTLSAIDHMRHHGDKHKLA